MPLSLESRLRGYKAGRRIPVSAMPLAGDLLGGREVLSASGSYYRIERDRVESFALPPAASEALRGNLQLLYGVGPRTEEKLRRLGMASLEDLRTHERWSGQAKELLRAIDARDIRTLQRRGARDRDVLSFFAPEDLVFIDIETTGLYCVLPLFLVGLLYAEGGRLRMVQFLARRFEEERSLLAAVAEELPRFKAFVSYNGRSFDLPSLSGRLLAHRLSCRLDQVHIDLLRHARRKLGNSLPDCRLSTIESAVLNLERGDDIPGHLIPEYYHRFVKTQDQTIIRNIIEHNAQDLLSMARLIDLVD